MAEVDFDVSRNVSIFAADLAGSVLHEGRGRCYCPFGFERALQEHAVIGFNSEYSDPVIGLFLLGQGHRAYSCTLMRFTSPDSFSPFDLGGLNAYAYCGNDPINFRDPSGNVKLAFMYGFTDHQPKSPPSVMRRETPEPIGRTSASANAGTSSGVFSQPAEFSGSLKSIEKRTHGRPTIYKNRVPRPVTSDYWQKLKADGDIEDKAAVMVRSYKAKSAHKSRGMSESSLLSAIVYKIDSGGRPISEWSGLSALVGLNIYKDRHVAVVAVNRNINRVVRAWLENHGSDRQ